MEAVRRCDWAKDSKRSMMSRAVGSDLIIEDT